MCSSDIGTTSCEVNEQYEGRTVMLFSFFLGASLLFLGYSHSGPWNVLMNVTRTNCQDKEIAFVTGKQARELTVPRDHCCWSSPCPYHCLRRQNQKSHLHQWVPTRLEWYFASDQTSWALVVLVQWWIQGVASWWKMEVAAATILPWWQPVARKK